MKSEHAITFVVPAYNAEKTLGRTIESILCQSDDRYQIVIVNDGSADRTAAIGQSYAARYPDQVRYVCQENKRQGGARNTGLGMVETGYVSFLDSDDWLMPGYVERILRQIERAEKPPEMIMTLPVIYHEQSHAVRDWYDRELFERIFPADGYIVDPAKEPGLYQFEVNICRKVLSMEFVRRTHFSFRENVKWEDVCPHFYLLSECHYCMGISVGFYYRIGESTQTTAQTGSDRMDILPVFEELLGYPEEGRENLIFPVMRVMLRFAFWCIRVADREIRKKLVDGIYAFFRKVPAGYFRVLTRESRRQYSGMDALQYALLAAALRHRVGRILFYDYLWQEICEKGIKKILKASNRVA